MSNSGQYDAGRNVLLDWNKRIKKLYQAQKITYINLFTYSAIMTAELIIGYMTHLTVLIADGLNNLTGVCGALILIFGLHMAVKPPDKSHVLGHWQFENVAALLSAAIMFAVSIQIFISGFESLQRYFAGETINPNLWSLGISLISGVLITGLALINSHQGFKLNNTALTASGKDLQSDAITSFGTFLSICGAYLGLKWLDGIATLIVGGFILHASITIFRTTIMKLTEGFDPQVIDKYSETVSNVDGVLGVQSIEPRYLGDQVVIQVGIYLADHTDLNTSYVIGERVENALMETYDILDADVKAYPLSLKKKQDVAD
ncbi:cation transporter [Lentilactobacillus curieae]|uniref:Cation transporter n=1 Tax=Lentilactobacillus curieae TaxID=1138822 RepID=A0A1S6QHT8_9LACO|nr:cation diffusion facilitator family transporter [Lentilactobacillus curieae]AQW21161.1 cation transporter [Lentilactobacillus curieae]